MDYASLCGLRLQFADSAYNLRIPLTVCGFHLQLRIPRQLQFAKHIYYDLFMDSTNWFRILLRIPQSCLFLKQFWATQCFSYLSVRGIQNSKEDQRKIAMLRIPRQIWFLSVVESAYISQNAQFGLVMNTFTVDLWYCPIFIVFQYFLLPKTFRGQLNDNRNIFEDGRLKPRLKWTAAFLRA